jgi:hypothetical protein
MLVPLCAIPLSASRQKVRLTSLWVPHVSDSPFLHPLIVPILFCSPFLSHLSLFFLRVSGIDRPDQLSISWSKIAFPDHPYQSVRPCLYSLASRALSLLLAHAALALAAFPSIATLFRCTHPVLLRVQSCMSGRLWLFCLSCLLLLSFRLIWFNALLFGSASSVQHTHICMYTVHSTCAVHTTYIVLHV